MCDGITDVLNVISLLYITGTVFVAWRYGVLS